MEVLEHGNKNEFYLKIGGPNESIVFEFYLNIFILNSYRNQFGKSIQTTHVSKQKIF